MPRWWENQSCGVRTSRYVWGCSQYSPRSYPFLKLISDCGVKCYDLLFKICVCKWVDLGASFWISLSSLNFLQKGPITLVPMLETGFPQSFYVQASQTVVCMGLSCESYIQEKCKFSSLDLRKGPKLCISNDLPRGCWYLWLVGGEKFPHHPSEPGACQ